METYKELPIIRFASLENWLTWLEANHAQPTGIWIKLAKKGPTPEPAINYVTAREGALLYGWIDGQANKYDENYYLVRFTPRRPKGLWSKINCDLVESFIVQGRMKPSGMAQVEAAKADGRWEQAYAGPATIEVPEDFQTALTASPKAQAFFEGLSKTNRYSFLYRIHTARRPETRALWIERSVALLEAGKTL